MSRQEILERLTERDLRRIRLFTIPDHSWYGRQLHHKLYTDGAGWDESADSSKGYSIAVHHEVAHFHNRLLSYILEES